MARGVELVVCYGGSRFLCGGKGYDLQDYEFHTQVFKGVRSAV